jgi:hypothetical protein
MLANCAAYDRVLDHQSTAIQNQLFEDLTAEH